MPRKGFVLGQLTREKTVEDIEGIHRKLARLTVDSLLGMPSALRTGDVLGLYPAPLRPKTTAFLKQALQATKDAEEAERFERLWFACIDLVITEQTADLADMLRFYMERGRMLVGPDKIPALEVVPWLQMEKDFDRREKMRKEMGIFLKGIVNPMLLGMLELTVKTVTERFGYRSYAHYAEEKKGVSFGTQAEVLRRYLDDTSEAYFSRLNPWVQEKIGRPMGDLSRYHALHLLRITRCDEFFPTNRLSHMVQETFQGLGFDLSRRSDVITDLSADSSKNPDGICVGVEIPGEVYVMVKPLGGLIDVETILHETGHAFFLSHMDASLPMEYRRLYRSGALDETFAFLFQDLVDNPTWLTHVGGLPAAKADELVTLVQTKRLCLIRRHIGKFLAEKELHENAAIKESEPYCRNLNQATGFVYEPQGYLIDMEPDFYSLDYVSAWAGSHVLRAFLETRFGEDWFRKEEAGGFLKTIASQGRRDSLETVLATYCGQEPRLPDFRNAS
jgi:hypothetical protein